MRTFTTGLSVVGVTAMLALQPASAQQTVKIGAYYFPPYVTHTADGVGGMLPEFVHAMNEASDTYRFEITPTSATRRYDDLEAGRFDLLAFANPDWGWEDGSVAASDIYLSTREVYVAAAEAQGGQRFFDNIADHKIAMVPGFSYGFADFSGDPDWVQRNWTVEQTLNPCTALYYVLDGRVDLAVVPEIYLRMFLQENPQYQGRFMTGETPDHVREHRILVRRGSAVEVGEINALLAELRENGTLDRMMEPYLF